MGLVQHALEKHGDAFVYAGARDPDKATALQELKKKFSGRLEVVKCVSGDTLGNAAVAKEIEERHGRVDTVIANAGTHHCPFRNGEKLTLRNIKPYGTRLPLYPRYQ